MRLRSSSSRFARRGFGTARRSTPSQHFAPPSLGSSWRRCPGGTVGPVAWFRTSVLEVAASRSDVTTPTGQVTVFNENQKQSVGEHGFAIQVNGDLTIQQNDPAQLRTMFEDLFKEGFPRQSAVAYEAGRSNVQELAVAIVDESQRANYAVSIDRLGNPDVHASLCDAINLTGRRGQAANPKLLAQLLVMRMYDQPTPLLDVVMSEAIQVVPKLTKPQLAFLVLLHARNGTIPDPLTYERVGANAPELAWNSTMQVRTAAWTPRFWTSTPASVCGLPVP